MEQIAGSFLKNGDLPAVISVLRTLSQAPANTAADTRRRLRFSELYLQCVAVQHAVDGYELCEEIQRKVCRAVLNSEFPTAALLGPSSLPVGDANRRFHRLMLAVHPDKAHSVSQAAEAAGRLSERRCAHASALPVSTAAQKGTTLPEIPPSIESMKKPTSFSKTAPQRMGDRLDNLMASLRGTAPVKLRSDLSAASCGFDSKDDTVEVARATSTHTFSVTSAPGGFVQGSPARALRGQSSLPEERPPLDFRSSLVAAVVKASVGAELLSSDPKILLQGKCPSVKGVGCPPDPLRTRIVYLGPS